jgi:glycosyltransferase involved in cell wall biosynthesis
MVKALNLNESVRFEPLLPPEKVADALSQFDIGTCPYLLNEFTHQTMPGKLFEYMAVGLPILSSARKPVIRIIMKEQNGIIYQARDPEEIGKRIIYMIENPDRCKSMGERGRKAVFDYYNSNTSLKVVEKTFVKYFY